MFERIWKPVLLLKYAEAVYLFWSAQGDTNCVHSVGITAPVMGVMSADGVK